MCIKFQPNRSTDGQDDATFEGKKRKPKFKGRTLTMYQRVHVHLLLIFNHLLVTLFTLQNDNANKKNLELETG